jgi:quercetin dioxygenase-like cupin family protein
MKTIERSAGIIGILSIVLLAVAWPQDHQGTTNAATEHAIHTPTQIRWVNGPSSLPAGSQVAVLEGDPTKEGFFTMRVRLPDGYKIPPHTHPKVEHVTVISGTFHFGMGDEFDQSATKEMPAGTFGFWPAGMKHFAWARGETVVQLHGIGPWSIEYLDPADDPRTAK